MLPCGGRLAFPSALAAATRRRTEPTRDTTTAPTRRIDTVSHESSFPTHSRYRARPHPRRSLRAFIVPTRALDRDYDSFRFDARASSRALSRARSTASRVGRAVARPHATRRTRHVRPRAVKCGSMDGWIGPQIHPHRIDDDENVASTRRRASSGVCRRGDRDRECGIVQD